MHGCVTVIYHFPEGFPRWRRMLSSPALSDLSFRIVQYLMIEQPERVNAESLAELFGAGRGRVYASLRQLVTWGYLRRKTTSTGYGRFRHFWQLTDEPFSFPDWPAEAVCAVSLIDAAESALVNSADAQRQPGTGTEPRVCSSGSKDKTSSVGKDRRRRVPRAFDLLALPEADRPHAAAAIALLEGLCVRPGYRPVLTPPLAAAIRDGWPVGALGHYLTVGMGTARNRLKVMAYRLRNLPSFDAMAGAAGGER